jgi:hypothetical protein
MVTASESLLKTRSWVALEFDITVCALGTLIVAVMPPNVRFISTTAPGEEPLSGALGTAA